MLKTTASFTAQSAEEEPVVPNPVFHTHTNGRVIENMMSISAMDGFRGMSHEELRLADWNLVRRLSDEEDLGIDRLKALSMGRAWEREAPLPIHEVSSATAGRSNKSSGLIGPPPLRKGPPSPLTTKGREPQLSDIAGNSNGSPPDRSCQKLDMLTPRLLIGIILHKPKAIKPASNPFPDPSLSNGANDLSFEVPSTPNVRVSSMLRAEADKSNRGNAEKEWADALLQAREAKAQLAKAQAAYNQAVTAERLKFTAYCETRRRFDE
ncbi:hypothetical protein FRC00_014604 [Tulasnella sp. 408]|nr:hypothetical protein FRC00_014604 [Tulasnella sp. 408]